MLRNSRSQYRNTCEFIGGSCDDKDAAFRVFAGYNFSPGLAIEAAYGDYGRVLADGSVGGVPVEFEATVEALDVSVLPAFVANDRLAIFGRLGIYRSKVQVHDLGGGGGSESERNSAWTYGLGVRLSFGGAIALRAEWQRYDNIGGSSTGEDDIDFMPAAYADDMLQNWRWSEQWLPHAAWYLYAIAAVRAAGAEMIEMEDGACGLFLDLVAERAPPRFGPERIAAMLKTGKPLRN